MAFQRKYHSNYGQMEGFHREAICLEAIEQGIAYVKPNKQEFFDNAMDVIKEPCDKTECLMKNIFIKNP